MATQIGDRAISMYPEPGTREAQRATAKPRPESDSPPAAAASPKDWIQKALGNSPSN
jgi:hypothetical protein